MIMVLEVLKKTAMSMCRLLLKAIIVFGVTTPVIDQQKRGFNYSN